MKRIAFLMKRVAFLLVAVAAVAGVVAATAPPSGHAEGGAALPGSAREVRGATPYAAIKNEPPPKLIVEPPLPGPLAQGVVYIPHRVEHLRILPVGGADARNVSPRVGHLYITVHDLPWQ